ncbi:hypothetical protein TNCV_4445761 [Trichonephila clavipes]|nr:hypothetical protein TNCV_4445761 [Trichonephila clavipes]
MCLEKPRQRADPIFIIVHHTGPQPGVIVWGAIYFDIWTPLVVIRAHIVRVQYFVRGGFVGHRSRVSSKHLSSSGRRCSIPRGKMYVLFQLQDVRVGVRSNKDADHC